jgi:hypothetical protein
MTERSERLEGRKTIGSKEKFKIERGGQIRERHIALGYNLIPGVNFLKTIHQ